MASSILCINFTPQQLESIRNQIPLEIHEGSFNVLKGNFTVVQYNGAPLYESSLVFLNLQNIEGLSSNLRSYDSDTQRLLGEFTQLAIVRGCLFVFLGNLEIEPHYFGLKGINLSRANPRDSKIAFCNTKKTNSAIMDTIKGAMTDISLPLSSYIIPSQAWLEEGYEKPVVRPILCNHAGHVVSAYVDHSSSWADFIMPTTVLLPQLKNLTKTVCELTNAWAKDFPDKLPEIYDAQWQNNDSLYPETVRTYNAQIATISEQAEKDIEELQKRKLEEKSQYAFLIELLTAQGDTLKQAVKEALGIIGVQAIDVDEQKVNQHEVLSEDLLYSEPQTNLNILIEVKGTRNQNPKLEYPNQPWQHIALSELVGEKKGALILNHDLKRHPDSRRDAYTKNNDALLKEIAFIDTRELHKLVRAKIDNQISTDEVSWHLDRLFSKGRYKFGLRPKSNQ